MWQTCGTSLMLSHNLSNFFNYFLKKKRYLEAPFIDGLLYSTISKLQNGIPALHFRSSPQINPYFSWNGDSDQNTHRIVATILIPGSIIGLIIITGILIIAIFLLGTIIKIILFFCSSKCSHKNRFHQIVAIYIPLESL